MAKEQQNQSQFEARSDSAALALRQSLMRSGAQIPESRKVEVGADGRPPAPLPPEGSYARQAIERQRRESAARQTEMIPDKDIQMQRQDPQATLQGDSVSPQQAQPAEELEQLSANANARIAKLTEDLRRKDQELQQFLEDSRKSRTSSEELLSKYQALEQQHKQLLEQSLSNMDPDTRAQVLLDGRLMEAIAQSEQRLMNQIMPHLQRFERQSVDAEIRRLSQSYPGFRADIHGPLIEEFRRGNPRCTIEQAFRAVAEPEELQLAPQLRATPVPPVVKPGNGRVPSRYVEEQKSSPEQELVEEAQQLKKLMSSSDPNDKSMRERFLQQHLQKRLDRILPR